jgi:hypothetical protein
VGLSLHAKRTSSSHSKEIAMNASIELLPVGVVLGLFVLMTAPVFAMIALLVVALAGFGALAALAGAVLAMPFLLGHSLVRHLRARSNAHTERTQEITVGTSTPVAAGRRLLAE